eukprot:Plantae.Rhodophyta-Palmaria_palmata.ctg9912.p1 GENE.Plantae.Rhodophyta-Palmaria_palmata.ctg9912~~Plantae.Rhodophyta-Palmaria_palmata.ctg9912.p1  ORF type:complete len:179 (+),score=11.21 Plantae.Rhodophyta-Palmaria_palmata.ctg9912:114-650(+)
MMRGLKMSGYAVFLFAFFIAFLSCPASAALANCVVQAFGTGLEGKGIQVQIQQSGFGCVQSWRDIKKSAKFDGTGEAEVPLRLHTNSFGICMVGMKITITLPYQCKGIDRIIGKATWAGIGGGQGSCRALQQRCGSVQSNAAVPYVDMYCRTPSGQVFEGMAQEMKLDWVFPISDDRC